MRKEDKKLALLIMKITGNHNDVKRKENDSNVMKLVFFMGGVHFANKNAASLTRNTRLPSTFWVAF